MSNPLDPFPDPFGSPPPPRDLTVSVWPKSQGDDDDDLGPSEGCWGTPDQVAAWMRAYADRISPRTARVRYLGTHPTHTPGEADR